MNEKCCHFGDINDIMNAGRRVLRMVWLVGPSGGQAAFSTNFFLHAMGRSRWCGVLYFVCIFSCCSCGLMHDIFFWEGGGGGGLHRAVYLPSILGIHVAPDLYGRISALFC